MFNLFTQLYQNSYGTAASIQSRRRAVCGRPITYKATIRQRCRVLPPSHSPQSPPPPLSNSNIVMWKRRALVLLSSGALITPFLLYRSSCHSSDTKHFFTSRLNHGVHTNKKLHKFQRFVNRTCTTLPFPPCYNPPPPQRFNAYSRCPDVLFSHILKPAFVALPHDSHWNHWACFAYRCLMHPVV